jgi:hypothetical protein
MNAQEVLVRLVREHTKSLLRAARCLPADKLNWQAGPGNRTPLSILRELATLSRSTPQIVRKRKMTWSPEEFAQYQAEAAKLTDFEDILARIESSTERIAELINATDPAVYGQPVEMPWPGDSRVVDILSYHLWNLNYHEGQLNYILMALGLPTPFDHA